MATPAVGDAAIAEAVAYVLERGYARVTLQFPDELLGAAPAAAARLQAELAAARSDAKVYVLADTTYNPLSVDEVAAQHVGADCVIHFGHASLTPVSRVPALCVLPRAPPLDAAECGRRLAAALGEAGAELEDGDNDSSSGSSAPWALVTYDQAHAWQLEEIKAALAAAYAGPLPVVVADVAPTRLDPVGLAPARGGGGGSGGGGCCAGAAGTEGACAASDKGQQADGCCGAAAGCSNGSGEQLQQQEEQEQQQQDEEGEEEEVGAPARRQPAAPYVTPPLGGLTWRAPGAGSSSDGGAEDATKPAVIVWLGAGDGGAALTHLQLTHSAARWLRLDPTSAGDGAGGGDGYRLEHGLVPGLDRLLRRRYFLVEKAKEAGIIGLLVGTLGAAGYLEALEALRDLAAQAGKKTYTFLMGKPSPAKLANFPEVGAFVMVAEPQGLVLDCRDFLAPIVTPHEALLAMGGDGGGDGEEGGEEGGGVGVFDAARYRLDYGGLLAWHRAWRARRGGGGGGAAGEAAAADAGDSSGGGGGGGSGALVAAGGLQLGSSSRAGGAGAVVARTAAEYLLKAREFRGLETPATGAEVKAAAAAVPGRAGRAAGYVDEPAR